MWKISLDPFSPLNLIQTVHTLCWFSLSWVNTSHLWRVIMNSNACFSPKPQIYLRLMDTLTKEKRERDCYCKRTVIWEISDQSNATLQCSKDSGKLGKTCSDWIQVSNQINLFIVVANHIIKVTHCWPSSITARITVCSWGKTRSYRDPDGPSLKNSYDFANK